MSMNTLPFNTKRGMSVESYMQNKNITTKICSATSVETQTSLCRGHQTAIQKRNSTLPNEKDPEILAERFNNFFTAKIGKIMVGLVPTNSYPFEESYIETKPQTNLTFSEFSPLTQEDARHLVKKSATKSHTLDSILTSLLKDHLDEFIPILTDIINSSLQSGTFPDDLKNAAVRPLLKKANLLLDDNSYRPVSNLSYLGKLIE